MAIEEKHSELSWEEAVARFLLDNPDYLDRNSHLLRQLEIPHEDTGKAVSLIERQVDSLRKNNHALEARLRQLVDNATENDALAGQLHRFTVDLMMAADLDQVLALVFDELKTRFKLDYLALKLFGEPGEKDCFVSADDPVINQVCTQVQKGQAVCGARFSAEEATALFGTDNLPEGSLALVPIRGARMIGLLVIGSIDPDRFGSGMATTYLDRIGELLGVAIDRFLNPRD